MTQEKYIAMPERFKYMITWGNPFMHLFRTSCFVETKKIKAKFKNLGFLIEIIKGENKTNCDRCFRYLHDQANKEKHMKICGRRPTLTFLCMRVERTLYCQMGCNIQTLDYKKMARHLYEMHTYEELRPWGINRDLILEYLRSFDPKLNH